MNHSCFKKHDRLAQTTMKGTRFTCVAAVLFVVAFLGTSGGGICPAQIVDGPAPEEFEADGGACMADGPLLPMDPIGDPEDAAGELNLDLGSFEDPLDSPDAVTEAFDRIDRIDENERGFSLIPEPGTLLTLALAGLMLFLLRRKW